MLDQDTVTQTHRIKVLVKCKTCGQKYVLRGTRKDDGHIDTGFKMCMCDSTDIETSVLDNSPTRM